MRDYIWHILENSNPDYDFQQFSSFGLHPVLEKLLLQRGVYSSLQASSFFKPHISQLHSPYAMKDMNIAINRMQQAIENNHKILVYGDYDVDGTTAVAMVFSFLKKLHCNVSFYVPDRYLEGYGVSQMGIQYAIDNEFQVIITLDCGIKALKTIEYATKHGIDVIVCDHHEPGEELPLAYAVLNPKRKDCSYPFKELSGCGVGFKLLQALTEVLALDEKSCLFCYLDILAISIASDIVPIIDENRVFMHFGLFKMKEKPLPGVQAMIKTAGIDGEITVSDVVFKIGPRINAAGRIYNARTAIELLISELYDDAVEICKTIDEYNVERREIDKGITYEALQLLEKDSTYDSKMTNVLYKPEWHKGVIGIVASRILETHYKPTVIFCGEGEILSASARSVADFDMYSAIEQCNDLLVNFGGHKYAAGLSIKKELYWDFVAKFESVVASRITPDLLVPKILIDAELQTKDVNEKFYSQLQLFAPFGPQNMTPVFIIRNLMDSGHTKLVGADEGHVKFSLCDPLNPFVIVDGIGFGLAEKWKQLSSQPDTAIDVCFVLRENVFRNRKSIQIEVRDIRISQ